MKTFYPMLVCLILVPMFSYGSADRMINLDPYSIESVEENFPEAIETQEVIENASDRNFIKGQGPKIIVKKKINYEKLIPEMIVLLKEQHVRLKALEKK